MWNSPTSFIDGICVRNSITTVQNDTSGSPGGIIAREPLGWKRTWQAHWMSQTWFGSCVHGWPWGLEVPRSTAQGVPLAKPAAHCRSNATKSFPCPGIDGKSHEATNELSSSRQRKKSGCKLMCSSFQGGEISNFSMLVDLQTWCELMWVSEISKIIQWIVQTWTHKKTELKSEIWIVLSVVNPPS